MRRAIAPLVAFVVLACMDSGAAPTTNLVDPAEKAAVQEALALSFGDDSVYTTLAAFVFPFIDQATATANASGDTTRLAGFQLEVVAGSLSGGVFGVLAWRGYHASTETVDSVFLVIGAGLAPPINDSLSPAFAVTLEGSGTAWAVAQASDSSVQTWLARAGALAVSSASFGTGTSAGVGGGFTITRSRGMLAGDYHLTARLVPDSSTTVTAAQSFPGGGIVGVKLRVSGSGPLPRVTRPEPGPSPVPTR